MPTDLEDSDLGEPTPQTNVVKVEIHQATHDDGISEAGWYFNALAGNGEIVVSSELYTTRASAERGARSVFPGVPQWNVAGVPQPEEENDGN